MIEPETKSEGVHQMSIVRASGLSSRAEEQTPRDITCGPRAHLLTRNKITRLWVLKCFSNDLCLCPDMAVFPMPWACKEPDLELL